MNDTEHTSTPSLIGDAFSHATTLVSAEMQLVRLEAGEKLASALKAVVSIVVAGVIALPALLVLLAGVVLALAKLVPTFVACFIVGGAFALVAIIMIALAIRNLSAAHLKPQRTLRQVQSAAELVRSPQ